MLPAARFSRHDAISIFCNNSIKPCLRTKASASRDGLVRKELRHLKPFESENVPHDCVKSVLKETYHKIFHDGNDL